MEINGKVVRILPLVTGQGKNGEWRKQEFIMETPGQYPKQVCISVWGDKIDEFKVKEGEELKAMIDVQSREHNNRWYTDVRAWRIDREGAQSAPSENSYIDVPPDSQEEDDLPF